MAPDAVKPDLVAPQDRTSWATGTVSSCAALLFSKANATPALANATKSRVLRALLIAGATRDKFPAWTISRSQPLDSHFGAGEVNILRSYHMLAAGEFAASGLVHVGATGWNYATTITAGSQKNYTFTVPDGCQASGISAALSWDRKITGQSGTNLVSPQPLLPNLNLYLYHSTNFIAGAEVAASESGVSGSVQQNVELIVVKNLPAGDYTLRVVNTGTPSTPSDYGLAWLTTLRPGAGSPTRDDIDGRPTGDAQFVPALYWRRLSHRILARSVDLDHRADAHRHRSDGHVRPVGRQRLRSHVLSRGLDAERTPLRRLNRRRPAMPGRPRDFPASRLPRSSIP